MKKLSVLLYSICLLGISIYGFSSHSYYVQLLISLESPYVFIRTALVAVLMVYAFVPWSRVYSTKALLGLGGVMLLSLGLTSIYSASLFGHLNTSIPIGDGLTLIEGGILGVVLSAELPARRSMFMARCFMYVRSVITTRPRKLTYSSPIQPAKIV